jgi:hypothetical protein
MGAGQQEGQHEQGGESRPGRQACPGAVRSRRPTFTTSVVAPRRAARSTPPWPPPGRVDARGAQLGVARPVPPLSRAAGGLAHWLASFRFPRAGRPRCTLPAAGLVHRSHRDRRMPCDARILPPVLEQVTMSCRGHLRAASQRRGGDLSAETAAPVRPAPDMQTVTSGSECCTMTASSPRSSRAQAVQYRWTGTNPCWRLGRLTGSFTCTMTLPPGRAIIPGHLERQRPRPRSGHVCPVQGQGSCLQAVAPASPHRYSHVSPDVSIQGWVVSCGFGSGFSGLAGVARGRRQEPG